jgi:hypothetical protein
MDLEERTLEPLGETCEECGARLTQRELETVIDGGGPALCAIHAAEAEPAEQQAVLDELA